MLGSLRLTQPSTKLIARGAQPIDVGRQSSLGTPLALGLILLASLLAFLGYVVVRAAWRIYLVRARRVRCERRVPR